MGWLDTIRNMFRSDPPRPRRSARRLKLGGTRASGGGRLSRDTSSSLVPGPFTIEAPASPDSTWRQYDLDADALKQMSPQRVVELLSDLSPDVSKALWDHLLFMNPGVEITALEVGGDEQHEDGQAALDEFVDALDDKHGGFEVIIGRLNIGAFLRGAYLSELVLDEAGRMPLDLATPDPYSVRFKKRTDPVLGEQWEIGQWQNGEWVNLEDETIRYAPIHPFPGSPYGRPLITPALFSTLFLLGLLHDLRRVVAQQGYPRLDIAVNLEKMLAAMPESIMEDDEEFETWVNDTIEQVQDVYEDLEPDEAYIHTDVVEVNRPVGAVDASSLGAVGDLIRALERMAVRALKTMPLLMGSNESSTETHANRQWELHAAGIKSLQHLLENMLGRLFKLALRVQGIQADVEVRFAELRASERLRDAQAEQVEIKNARSKYDAGWISQDEASEEVTGSPADEEEPRVSGSAGFGDVLMGETGQQVRWLQRQSTTERRLLSERVKVIPDGDTDPLPPVPAEVEVTESDKDRAPATWDELMGDYAGLIGAEVVGKSDFDPDETQSRQTGDDDIDPDDATPEQIADAWLYYVPLQVYANMITEDAVMHPVSDGTVIDDIIGEIPDDIVSGSGAGGTTTSTTTLRNEFIDEAKGRLDDLAEQVIDGEISVQRWVTDFRRELKDIYVNEYTLAKGGAGNMTQTDWGSIGRQLKNQYEYLQDFAEEFAGEGKSLAQVQARSRLYAESASQAFERGKARSYGMSLGDLPQYPGDGNTVCRTNCRCEWVIEETDDAWECTWHLNPAEHCSDCLELADRWAPYVIAKERMRRNGFKELAEAEIEWGQPAKHAH